MFNHGGQYSHGTLPTNCIDEGRILTEMTKGTESFVCGNQTKLQ